MTQVAQITHSGLEHLLFAAVFGRTARGGNANSPPCPDHHTRERKKKQEHPDLHRLSIAQSGTGRCVKSARRINRHRPTFGRRGYRAISSALADPVAKVGNIAGAGRLYTDIDHLQPMSYPMEGPLRKKSTSSTWQDAEAFPRQ